MTGTRRTRPRYAELGDLLQSAIERGDYAVGALLPTEMELCERFDVSRHTARAALARLISAGLVQRRPGVGTRVIAQNAAIRYEHGVDSMELLMQYASSTRLELLSGERLQAGTDMARLLEIGDDDGYLRLTALRLEAPSHPPIALTEMLVPVQPGLAVEALLDPARVASAIAEYLAPARLSRVEQVFDAASFDAQAAKVLGIRKNEPALRVVRRYRDARGMLLMMATSLHPPGRFAYRTVLVRGHS